MNIKNRRILTAALLLAVFAAGIGAGALVYRNTPESRKLEEVKRVIDNEYLFGGAPESDEDWVYSGLMGSIGDRYARYYSKAEYEEFQAENNGSYVGIGAQVNENTLTGEKTVVHCYESGPAAEAGLKAGDKITEVAGVPAEDKALQDLIADYIKGEAGTFVELTVFRPDTGETLAFSVERRDVAMETVGSRMLENSTGYIRVVQFLENTAGDFAAAVDALQREGASALVIDLRDNPGGSLTAVSKMADYIIEDDIGENSRCLNRSTLAYTLNKSGNSVSLVADDGHSVSLPVVILINGNSASASELFAGALRDSGKALLLGTGSYGKGIVQSTVPLSDGSAVKLTVSQYYTPSGFALHGVGLEPDVELERDKPIVQSDTFISREALDHLSADNQTEAALALLEEIKAGKRTLGVVAGENNKVEAPAGFTEFAQESDCKSPHFALTADRAGTLLPDMAEAQGLRLFSCEDDWNGEGEVARGNAALEHERSIELLDAGDGTGNRYVRFGCDVLTGQAHWFSVEKLEPEATVKMAVGLLENAVDLPEDELGETEKKLQAVSAEGGSLRFSGKGFSLEAVAKNGTLSVYVYAGK